MNNQKDQQEQDQEKTSKPQAPAPLTSEDLTRAKNPNPRANNNIENGIIDTDSSNAVGSEITDGEGG